MLTDDDLKEIFDDDRIPEPICAASDAEYADELVDGDATVVDEFDDSVAAAVESNGEADSPDGDEAVTTAGAKVVDDFDDPAPGNDTAPTENGTDASSYALDDFEDGPPAGSSALKKKPEPPRVGPVSGKVRRPRTPPPDFMQ